MSLVSQGQFNKSVNVLMGHNSWEGAFFFDPAVDDDEKFAKWIDDSVAGLSQSQIKELVEVMYPAVFDGSVGYSSQAERQMKVWGEGYFDCNFQLLSEAIEGKGYACKCRNQDWPSSHQHTNISSLSNRPVQRTARVSHARSAIHFQRSWAESALPQSAS